MTEQELLELAKKTQIDISNKDKEDLKRDLEKIVKEANIHLPQSLTEITK